VVRERFYRSLTPRGQNLFQFRQRYGIAPRVRYAVTSRKNTDSLVDGMIFLDQGGGEGRGKKVIDEIAPPRQSVVGRFFLVGGAKEILCSICLFPPHQNYLAGEDPPDPLLLSLVVALLRAEK